MDSRVSGESAISPLRDAASNLQPQDPAGRSISPHQAYELDSAVPYSEDLDGAPLQDLEDALTGAVPAQPGQDRRPIRRHDQDQVLVDRLAINGFADREYDLYNEALVRYGFIVSLSWIQSGTMIRHCKIRGRPVGPLPADATQQDRRDLAVDTAVEGSVLFRRIALMERRWSPERGASLKTYYIGACIQSYPNVYRRWYRQHSSWYPVAPDDPSPDSQWQDGPENHLIVKMIVEEAISTLDEATKVALTMRADGFPHRAIAEVLGKTEKSVERMLDRGRRRCSEILERLGGQDD